ncbi:MAG: hypothetical protein AB1695_08730 [Stygiobacter sp.]|jgi:hypothetical protein|uniref:Uncharacterized protein n=1 Tax=Stygiobacter electus TaxID=3032292 RepID=A0AAE3P2Y2_9BACT|nr:hypothetical protein [Stygiobacter electus]MDF1611920.1 hypothetical protein [Stygiobacter electus]
MNNSPEIFTSLVEKLNKDFSLEGNNLPVNSDFEILKKFFTEKVKELMSSNYDRFLNSLYRIDVDETKLTQILHSKDKTTIAEKLADLIIERQLLRVKTQLLYKQSKNK